MSKKQRLEHGTKVTKEESDTPRILHVGNILGQTHQEFVTSLLDNDGGNSCISQEKLNAATEELNAAKAKLEEMSVWAIECKIRLEREDRVSLKTQRQEKLNAIYCNDSNSVGDKNNPYFSLETAMALLDSGFLSSQDAGKLFLMTGKYFISTLQLDPNHVWKQIFEARFSNKAADGLESLYQSHKFKQLLLDKGYEWVFRNFFAPKLPRESECGHSIRQLPSTPGSALNSQNFFFIVLFSRKDDFGFCKTVHAQVLDNEHRIEDFMLAANEYECTISSEEMLESIKGLFMDHQSIRNEDSSKKIDRINELRNKVKANPEQFPRGLLNGLDTSSVLDIAFGPRVTILALRMDSRECTLIYDQEKFEWNGGHFSMGDEGAVALNRTGEELMQNIWFDLDQHHFDEPSVSLQHDFCLKFDGRPEQLQVGLTAWCDELGNMMESGMDLFPVFDYGIDWEGF